MKSNLIYPLLFCGLLIGCANTAKNFNSKHINATANPTNVNSEKFVEIEVDGKINKISNNGKLFHVQRFERNGVLLDKINLPSKLMFGYDRDKVSKEAHYSLGKLVKSYSKALESNYIYVVGHTDSDGSNSYNVGLSSRRSMNVVKKLQGYGVSAEHLYVIPAGESMPLLSNISNANKAVNRRVEIYLSKSRDLALQYLRDAACPDNTCNYAEVSILKVDRNFGMTNKRVDLSIPESVVIMETDYKKRTMASNKKTRNIKAFPIEIRDVRILVYHRNYKLLKKEYLIKPDDKRRQRLSIQL
jgi:outer membrane protein OmpA-like peptidoglycan-associated protein